MERTFDLRFMKAHCHRHTEKFVELIRKYVNYSQIIIDKYQETHFNGKIFFRCLQYFDTEPNKATTTSVYTLEQKVPTQAKISFTIRAYEFQNLKKKFNEEEEECGL